MKRIAFFLRWIGGSGNDNPASTKDKRRRARPALLTLEDRNSPTMLVGLEAGILGASIQRDVSPPPEQTAPTHAPPFLPATPAIAPVPTTPASVPAEGSGAYSDLEFILQTLNAEPAGPMGQATAIPPPAPSIAPPATTPPRTESQVPAVAADPMIGVARFAAVPQLEGVVQAAPARSLGFLAPVAPTEATSVPKQPADVGLSLDVGQPVVDDQPTAGPVTTPSLTVEALPMAPTGGRWSFHEDTRIQEASSPAPSSGQVTVFAGTQETAKPLEEGTPLFRIIRSGGGETALPVSYTLTVYGTGATSGESIQRSAVLSAGSTHAIVLAGKELAGRRPEVVTMRAHEGAGHVVATPTATRLFVPADGRISDGALFEAFQRDGSQVAFDQLVRQHRPMVQRTCQRILGDRFTAEDACQSVFLALAGLQLRYPGTLAGWLQKVARNTSIGLLRSRKRREKRESLAAREDRLASLEQDYMAGEELDFALRMLPPTLREAVTLRYLDGRSQQEAAQIIGVPRGTLSRRAADGIERLRAILAPS